MIVDRPSGCTVGLCEEDKISNAYFRGTQNSAQNP